MNADFARSLALLRQERGISQRQAAAELGISQALLSHYGAREPGLNFVVKACDFYNVSADFLLGRTLSRDGTTIVGVESLYDVTGERDNVLQGSVMATLAKKLIVNSTSVLFDLLGKVGNKQAIRAAVNFLSTSVYILYRHLHQASARGNESVFAVPREQFQGGVPVADLLMSQADYVEALRSEQRNGGVPSMSHDEMSAAYPGTYQSLLQIVHVCGGRLNGQMAFRRRKD